MASDKAQLNRHVHFKKTLEDVGDVVVDVERGLVEDTGKYLNKAIAFIKIDYFTNNNKCTYVSQGVFEYALYIISIDLRSGRKVELSSNNEVPKVEVTTSVAVETTPIQVKIYTEEKDEKEAEVEKKPTEKPKAAKNKESNCRIEKCEEKEKAATKIEEIIVEEKKDEDAELCIYGMRGN